MSVGTIKKKKKRKKKKKKRKKKKCSKVLIYTELYDIKKENTKKM